jgi:hypothetical protein
MAIRIIDGRGNLRKNKGPIGPSFSPVFFITEDSYRLPVYYYRY